MRIPQVGDPILFVLRAAKPDDKLPAIIRPGVIVNVGSYGPKHAEVNAVITIDGTNDTIAARNSNVRAMNDLQAWATSVSYSEAKNNEADTWHYAEDVYKSCEEFRVIGPITHGRETIRKGAVGVWDQAKDTITFCAADVQGLHEDDTPSYPAQKFIDLHCARLEAPEGMIWMQEVRMREDDSEAGCEREQMMASMHSRDEALFQRRNARLLNYIADQLGLPGFLMSGFHPLIPDQFPHDYQPPMARAQGNRTLRDQNSPNRAAGRQRMEIGEGSKPAVAQLSEA